MECHYVECHYDYAECHYDYAECRDLYFVLLNVIMLRVVGRGRIRNLSFSLLTN
jgi:hypothetical protein